jgi:hypothetical protein
MIKVLGNIKEQKYRREWELNPRHMDYDSIVLTTELFRQIKNMLYIVFIIKYNNTQLYSIFADYPSYPL